MPQETTLSKTKGIDRIKKDPEELNGLLEGNSPRLAEVEEADSVAKNLQDLKSQREKKKKK